MIQQECGVGCQICSSQFINEISQCKQCYDDYLLDNGVCIYQGCQPKLYLQLKENSEKSCQSICDPYFYYDTQSKTCVKLIECTTNYSTLLNTFFYDTLEEFLIYQELYYIAIQKGSLSIYNRNDLGLIKQLKYEQDDLTISNINGLIIVLKQDFSINIWDVINENRNKIEQASLIQVRQQTQYISLFTNYLLIFNVESEYTQFQIIYDQQKQQQFISNIIQINQSFGFITILNNLLFMGNQTNLTVYQVSFQPQINVLNFTNPINFTYADQGQLLQVLQTSISSSYFLIYSNCILQIDTNEQKQSFLLNQSSIQKVKIIEAINLIHLIILTQVNLIDFDCISKQSRQISNQKMVVADFDIGNFSGMNNQLIILFNQNQLQIWTFVESQIEQSQQIITLSVVTQSLNKLQIDYHSKQVESLQNFEIAFTSSNKIQIIKQSKSQKFYLETNIIENFSLPFPTPTSLVNSLILVSSPPVLISCHRNGDLNFYDASKGINTNLIQQLRFPNQSCFSLQRFYNNQIAVQFSQNVLLIDPSSQIILNKLEKLQNIVQIISNYDKLAINYNNCIQILSQDFISLFKECQTLFSSNNINIGITYDLKIVMQKQQQISVYQINLDNQQYKLINQITTQYTIQYFNYTQIFNSDRENLLNQYIIDEIVYFDNQSNFYICDMQLTIIYTINISLIQTVVQVKRVIDDSSVYFLAGIQYVQGSNSIFLISKNIDYPQLIHTSSYFPTIQEPKKVINGFGNVFYSIKRVFLLNFFTLIEEFQIDLKRNITYAGGLDYINGNKESIYLDKMIGSSQNFQIYIGTRQGLIYTANYQQDRYQQLNTTYFMTSTQNSDQIQEIIQSAQLGLYFIRTKYLISSFNIFTNQFIEYLNTKNQNDPPYSSFGIVPNNIGIICWNKIQLLYVIYNNTSQKMYYQSMNKINGWILDVSSNNFYIYGSSLQLLNPELKLLQTSTDDYQNIEFIQCQDSSQNIFCSISINQFVIVTKQMNKFTIQSIQVTDFTTQFLISIDEKYQNILLYSDLIQIFSFQGFLQQEYQQYTQFISCTKSSSSLLFQSNTFIFFIARQTLQLKQNSIQAPSGLFIENYIYIDFFDYIVLYTNLAVFAQIYVYDYQSLQNIAKINGYFAQNQIGIVVDMFFDYSSAYLAYLDTYGNIYLMDLYDDFPVQNFYKITEVLDRNEQLVGFSFDNITNNLLVYSTNSVYQIDLSIAGYNYEVQQDEPNSLYTQIPLKDQSFNLEFLFFNNDNVIFRYQNQNIIFERMINGSQIVDLIYIDIYDTLLIALKDSILFFQNYQDSIVNNYPSKLKVLEQIQFFKFLQFNIFLTYDKKIIYCNVQTGQVIHFVQIQGQVIVTYHICSADKMKIFIGLSNGQALHYDLSDFSQKYYSITNSNQINTSIISIALVEAQMQTQMAYFVSNGGVLLIVDITNKKQIQELNLIEIVQEDPTIVLKDFILDIIYSRYIFIFNGQKKGYVWNFLNNKLEQHLALTKNQGNKLYLTENFLIAFCTFQLNIFQVSDKISLFTVIKRNFADDQITDYKIINNNIIVIFFILKYEVFLLQNQSNRLIFQQFYTNPRYLGSIYNQEDNTFKLYGLHQVGVFENNYSISLYNSDLINECTTIIQDNDISQLYYKIQSVSPKQDLLYTFFGSSTQDQEDWMNVIQLQVKSEQFININRQINEQYITKPIFLFQPQQEDNNLLMTNETLQYIQQPQMLIFNYNLIFLNEQQTTATLNQNIQTVIWQNITIYDQCLDNIQINLSNVNTLVFQSIKISQLIKCRKTINQDNQLQFFNFYNISQIFIYDLQISNFQLDQKLNFTLFNFVKIQTVLIDGLNITSNHNISSFFQFIQINNITMKNISVTQNSNFILDTNIGSQQKGQTIMDNLQSDSVFNFFGCKRVSHQDKVKDLIVIKVILNKTSKMSQNSILQSFDNQSYFKHSRKSIFRQKNVSTNQSYQNCTNDIIIESSVNSDKVFDSKQFQMNRMSPESSIMNYNSNNLTLD
ncbi:hypothetical protein ABPG73_020886 [Tetrahymena malaccensis]